MEELKVTVSTPTAKMLHDVANKASIPIGEIIDRLVLDVAPENPDSAFIIVLEQYLICTSRLSREGSAKVFGNICGTFLGSLLPEELDEIVSIVKSSPMLENHSMEPITEEEDAEVKKALSKILFTMRDKNMREVLYTLFHG